jgi:hypothetical protein
LKPVRYWTGTGTAVILDTGSYWCGSRKLYYYRGLKILQSYERRYISKNNGILMYKNCNLEEKIYGSCIYKPFLTPYTHPQIICQLEDTQAGSSLLSFESCRIVCEEKIEVVHARIAY